MNLLEYQAKELFREVGIPVPPSQYIDEPRQIRQLALSYPLVLKSQVRAVGRAKAGGIRFVENTIDAIAAARALFGLPIRGQCPRVLLVEARYPVQQELFLAVAIDYQQQRPVLLGAAAEDLKGKKASQQLKRVAIEGDFSPFYARRLAIAIGLQDSEIAPVAETIAKMYQLWESKDLDSVEINPLGLNECGEVMALDGKIAVNDDALARHPELLALANTVPDSDRRAEDSEALYWFEKSGKIGIICTGIGSGMALWDALSQKKGKPACCWVLEKAVGGTLVDSEQFIKALETGLARLRGNQKLAAILIDISGGAAIIEAFTEALLALNADAALEEGPCLVVRLLGDNSISAKERLEALPIIWAEDFDTAVARAIACG